MSNEPPVADQSQGGFPAGWWSRKGTGFFKYFTPFRIAIFWGCFRLLTLICGGTETALGQTFDSLSWWLAVPFPFLAYYLTKPGERKVVGSTIAKYSVALFLPGLVLGALVGPPGRPGLQLNSISISGLFGLITSGVIYFNRPKKG